MFLILTKPQFKNNNNNNFVIAIDLVYSASSLFLYMEEWFGVLLTKLGQSVRLTCFGNWWKR